MFGMQRRYVVVRAVMRRAVGADQTAAVQSEHDRQVLQCDVVNQLVIRALQERRVDRDHRLHAVAREACRKRHRVLLGDSDIEIAVRILLLETHHARAFAHGRRNADHALVECGDVAQPVAEYLRVTRLAGRRLLDPDARIELARTVIEDRIGFRQLVSLALGRDYVKKLRPIEQLDVLERRNQRLEVVPIDRTDVVEAELLEQRPRHDHALGVLLELAGQLEHRREVLQHLLAGLLGRRVEPAAHQPREIAVQPPTAGEIDMSLSFSITSRRMLSVTPALFNASNAIPALIAPSPMIAIECRLDAWLRAATAMPSAAEIEGEEWAVPNVSYSLSERRGKPDMPPYWRNRAMPSRRPVRILCAYVWWPTSHTRRSSGVSKT
jgi:hypothetical protein